MRVEHLGLPAREPMIVEERDGTLFLAGYSGGLYLKGLLENEWVKLRLS
jgi:hypothetical protein